MTELLLEYGYIGLFLGAFIAATLLTFPSELLLTTLHLTQEYHWQTLWFWATFGNVLGSFINWALGRYFLHFRHHSWFPFSEKSIEKSQTLFHKYGVWTLLFAWAPVVGDVLTLIAGVFRVPIVFFLVLVTIGKGARYGIVILALSTTLA